MRLILAGVVAVIALTVWGSLRVSARNEAERTIVASVKLAEQALAENDLGEAARRFQEVRQALDILGRTDAHARELRQTAAEITASAELTRSSLFDILHEAVTTMARSGPAMWNDTFRSSYRDEWVLIDANVSRNPAGSNRQKFEIDYPLSSGSDRAQLVGDLPFFEQVVQGGSPQRVIFAAQLEDFSRSPNTEVTWQVVLRPGTAFLWTAPANLERLGLELDDETRSVLERQGNLVGGYQ